jgi:hypothetical protein
VLGDPASPETPAPRARVHGQSLRRPAQQGSGSFAATALAGGAAGEEPRGTLSAEVLFFFSFFFFFCTWAKEKKTPAALTPTRLANPCAAEQNPLPPALGPGDL